MHEDIMMAFEASFVGMSMIFPILFRLQFRFASRTVFTVVASGLIACNLICVYICSIPVLVFTCFVTGAIRMWGTFECFSSIPLRITPARNFAVFFPVIYSIIFGCVQLSGLVTVYLGYFFEWQYMHYLAIGLLLPVIALSRLLLRRFHEEKPLPLSGIDWAGAILWCTILLLLVFVCEYGEYYDWLHSPHIRLALFAAMLLLILCFYRMKQFKNTYIEARAYRHPHVFTMLFLYMSLCLLSATSTVLENAFTGEILHYGVLNAASLNWARFAGVIAGGVLTCLMCVRFHIPYKTVVFTGFALLSGSQMVLYFLISPGINYAAQIVPFQHLFQVFGIMGIIREGIGSPIATALVGRTLKIFHQANYLSLSGELDAQNHILRHLPFDALYGEVQRHAARCT